MIRKVAYGVTALVILVSCNKDFPNLLQNFNEAKDSPSTRDKVLLVIVDGLSGSAVQAIEPEGLTSYTRNGLVTYGSLADPTTNFEVTNASVATALLTGVNSAKNKVVSDDLSVLDAAQYPTVFSKLKNVGEGRRSTFFTSSDSYKMYLGKDATVDKKDDDAAVTTAAVNNLKADSADLNVVHLADVEKAGNQHGFGEQFAGYVDAIEAADKRIQQLVETIKSRSSYNNENWLIVITSGKGGNPSAPRTDFTAYGDAKRNTYTLIYSPKFSRKILPRPNAKDIPFVGNATRFSYSGSGKVTGSLKDVNKFNISTSEDWTITFFAKHNVAGSTYNYATFLSKRSAGFSGNGWNIFSENGGWGFNSAFASQTFGTYINDGEWHALTVVIKRSGSQDSIYTYTDGTKNAISGKVSQNVISNSNFDNTNPFTIGYLVGNGETADLSICNLQVYNRAFTFQEVQQYGGVTHITEASPFWNNLQGYWPGYDDVNTNKLTDKSGKGAGDFDLKGPTSWISFNELVPFFQPPINEAFFRQVPNAVDVPFMIYQWLGVTVESSWNLDGKSWSPNYTQIRN